MGDVQSLDYLVIEIISEFIDSDTLFTALDVSNEVKKAIPQAKHKEVREVVRNEYQFFIEPSGWSRTPITVNLEDGTTATALLYHPSSVTDLDNKYNQQQRSAISQKISNSKTLCISKDMQGNVSALVQPNVSPHSLWENLFKTQSSLFPQR